MKTFDSDTLDRLDAGEVDYIDAVTFIFDSGIANMWLGGVGQFEWTDAVIGTQTFYGGGGLLQIEVPSGSLQGDSPAVNLTLAETYMVEGSDTPVNVFDDGGSPSFSIDDEPWQGREAIMSTFWRDAAGTILMREQIERRQMDSMMREVGEDGLSKRIVALERPDIIQREVEGKTDNAELQYLIDPDDLGYQHVRSTATQKISFGRLQDEDIDA